MPFEGNVLKGTSRYWSQHDTYAKFENYHLTSSVKRTLRVNW